MTPRLKQGDANPRNRLRNAPLISRLLFRTALMDDGCWQWLGAASRNGYGNIRDDMDGPMVTVHRATYQHFVGPIPDGLELDHLCRNRRCVNPDHLEAVTHAENVRRGLRNQNYGKTVCDNGHVFTPDNTAIDRRLGKRACRACGRERTRAYRSRLLGRAS